MTRNLTIAAAVILMVITAVVQGRWSERWGEFPELKLYADQFKKVPMEIDGWQGEPRDEPDAETMRVAGADGSLSRDYRNAKGETVSVFLVSGRMVNMFVHEPKRCYGAAGFEMRTDPERKEIKLDNGETADFYSARFEKTDEGGRRQDQVVYWSWSGSGKWIATTNHKWTFGGQRAVYKLYVIYTPNNKTIEGDNPAEEFIPLLIPELNKAFQPAYLNTPESAGGV